MLNSAPTPISHSSIQEQTVDRLRDDIINGSLPPGEPLRIDALATRLGVSHMPVREALHILAMEGLAERNPRRGVVVSDLTAEAVIQAYHTLAALEAQAAQQAALMLSEQDLADLEAIHQEWLALPADAPRADRLTLNRRFHGRYEACVPNRWRDEFCRQLRNYIYRLRRSYPQAERRLAAMAGEHAGLLVALRGRDPERAGRLAHAHCLASLEDLLARLAEGGAQV
jgi:DNA-binding GntR family transcriptional regulator